MSNRVLGHVFCVFSYVFAGIAGSAATTAYFLRPRQPDSYRITAKERCLTDAGISFTLSYSGTGDARFNIVPPQQAAPAAKGNP